MAAFVLKVSVKSSAIELFGLNVTTPVPSEPEPSKIADGPVRRGTPVLEKVLGPALPLKV